MSVKKNMQKAAAMSLMGNFGAKVNKEEPKKEEVKEQVIEAAEVTIKEEVVTASVPKMVEETIENKEVKADMVDVPAVAGTKIEVAKKETETVEKAVEAAIKEDAKVKEKTVSYNFHIPYKLVKRLNRVIDEMKENDIKILKKDFIVLAVEQLVTEYEKKYDTPHS